MDVGFTAALAALAALAFLELLKAAITRGRDAAINRRTEEQFQAQKLASCLAKIDALTHERDEWKEKYFHLLHNPRP
jgi:hypothetical protein